MKEEGDIKVRIISLTSIGEHEASSPVSNPSTARSILYFLRRHQGRASDDSIREFVVDGAAMQVALNQLLRARAITIVG